MNYKGMWYDLMAIMLKDLNESCLEIKEEELINSYLIEMNKLEIKYNKYDLPYLLFDENGIRSDNE